MGNWRTVTIVGTCDPKDVPALRTALNPGRDFENLHCLVNGGLMGLPNWGAPDIDATGNLAERGYDVDDVIGQLEQLVGIAPSLALKVHCGGDNEDKACIATVTVADGQVTHGPPEIESVGEISAFQMRSNFLDFMQRG